MHENGYQEARKLVLVANIAMPQQVRSSWRGNNRSVPVCPHIRAMCTQNQLSQLVKLNINGNRAHSKYTVCWISSSECNDICSSDSYTTSEDTINLF